MGLRGDVHLLLIRAGNQLWAIYINPGDKDLVTGTLQAPFCNVRIRGSTVGKKRKTMEREGWGSLKDFSPTSGNFKISPFLHSKTPTFAELSSA